LAHASGKSLSLGQQVLVGRKFSTGQKNRIDSLVLGETWVVNPKMVSSSHIAANRGLNPRFIPAFKRRPISGS